MTDYLQKFPRLINSEHRRLAQQVPLAWRRPRIRFCRRRRGSPGGSGASSSCVVRGMNANLQINDAVADAYPILSRHWPDFPYKLETGAVKGTPSPEHLAQRLDHIFAEPPP